MISHSKKFVFIHVFKTGGTSLKQALAPYADEFGRPSPFARLMRIAGLAFGRSGFEHPTAQALADHLGDQYCKYFSFGYVRNPWDWHVSLYHYMCQHRMHAQHREVKKLADFDDYVRWRADHPVREQSSFFYSRTGVCLVDQVCRFETLSKDFHAVCNKLGLEGLDVPHTNRSVRGNYQQYYSACSVDAIEHMHSQDVSNFGYRFEG